MTTDDRRGAGDAGDVSDEVAFLVRLAGPTSLAGPIAAERLARVRTAVYSAWSEEYVARQMKTRRRRRTVAMLFAAAASVVIAVAIWGTSRTPAPVSVAHVDHFTGQGTGSPGPFAAGGAVMGGSTVTTSTGTLAMTLTSGVHLRLDASSTARVDSATNVWLERGAVYVDSAGAPGASPISIHTRAGVVSDIGTKFDVRLDDAGMRVRVLDGEVRVTDANGAEARVRAGEELFSRAGSDGSTSPRPSAATGSEWAWAERAAPPFSMEGNTCGAFLDWVSHEGAWTVTFADSRQAAAARAFVLYDKNDRLKGLTLFQALDVVLPICGLRHSIDIKRRQLVIEKDSSKGESR